MRVNNFQDNPRFKNIFSGIYSGQNGYSASFLLPDNSLEGKRLISAHGSISYDEINAAYQVGNDTINGVLQDRVVFFNDECRMSARGELHFDKSGMVFDLKSFGELDFDLNSNTLKANALMAVDFAMDQRLMQAIASDFENSAPLGNFQLNSEISDYTLSRLSGRVISSSALGEIDIFSGRNNANTDLQYPILLENVKLTWDSENNAFVSDDQLYLNHFDKRAINKFFKGKVELLKVGSNYELTVYLINDEGKYYYFRFVGDVVDFYTDQKSAMDMFDGISERDKELSFKGKKMRFKKASRLKVATFQRKYVF